MEGGRQRFDPGCVGWSRRGHHSKGLVNGNDLQLFGTQKKLLLISVISIFSVERNDASFKVATVDTRRNYSTTARETKS